MSYNDRCLIRAVLASFIAAFAGCASSSSSNPTTRTSIASPRVAADADYWFDQPGFDAVTGNDFEHLWASAERTARTFFFTVDRRDRRGGVLITEPMISQQWFEPWRRDVRDGDDLAESSLGSVRRTVRFDFERRDDGTFAVTPKVLVERYSLAENRVTSVVLYRAAFRSGRVSDLTPYGTKESDRGIALPARYWYAIGRDPNLELAIANDLSRRANR